MSEGRADSERLGAAPLRTGSGLFIAEQKASGPSAALVCSCYCFLGEEC